MKTILIALLLCSMGAATMGQTNRKTSAKTTVGTQTLEGYVDTGDRLVEWPKSIIGLRHVVHHAAPMVANPPGLQRIDVWVGKDGAGVMRVGNSGWVPDSLPCKQAKEIRLRLGDRLDGLMYMPDTIPGKLTDSIITIRQWVEKLEADCDSLRLEMAVVSHMTADRNRFFLVDNRGRDGK